MADETYRLSLGFKVLVVAGHVFALAVFTVFMVTASSEQDPTFVRWFAIVWLAGVAVQGLWMYVRWPRSIDVTQDGVCFVRPRQSMIIPWSKLRSVSSPWYDLNRLFLHWSWEGGRTVTTPRAYVRLHRLLYEVEQRAPQADVRL